MKMKRRDWITGVALSIGFFGLFRWCLEWGRSGQPIVDTMLNGLEMIIIGPAQGVARLLKPAIDSSPMIEALVPPLIIIPLCMIWGFGTMLLARKCFERR
jgi:hypothetical protein